MDYSDDPDPGGALAASENDADANFSLAGASAVVYSCPSGDSFFWLSPAKKHWIEIATVDAAGNPVSGIAYRITVPDGTEITGSTDAKGRGRVNGIDSGRCKITFPELDECDWQRQ